MVSTHDNEDNDMVDCLYMMSQVCNSHIKGNVALSLILSKNTRITT